MSVFWFCRQFVVQFAQGAEGHRAGNFPAGRRGELLLGVGQVAFQGRKRRGLRVIGVFQRRRGVAGHERGDIQIGFHHRSARKEIFRFLSAVNPAASDLP